MSYEGGYKIYRSFMGTVGNLPLNQIKLDHVVQFLDCSKTSVGRFRIKHGHLRRFFDYWAAHGVMPRLPMPANRPAQRSRFLPYIYTREEIHRLLSMASRSKKATDKIHYKTVRAIVLMLYATGATVSEVTTLSTEDVDLRDGFIRFSGNLVQARRSIPICKDILRAARQYAEWRRSKGAQTSLFFSRIDGTEISPRAIRDYFERLRRMTGIVGYRESSQWPCLRDFRATFAVHQISKWIKRKQDLDVMLPGLGVYMGNVGLESSERYLQLTPQRFESALNLLSPQRRSARWRDDPALLEFLMSL
jgi:site-specific recombinase XerD